MRPGAPVRGGGGVLCQTCPECAADPKAAQSGGCCRVVRWAARRFWTEFWAGPAEWRVAQAQRPSRIGDGVGRSVRCSSRAEGPLQLSEPAQRTRTAAAGRSQHPAYSSVVWRREVLADGIRLSEGAAQGPFDGLGPQIMAGGRGCVNPNCRPLICGPGRACVQRVVDLPRLEGVIRAAGRVRRGRLCRPEGDSSGRPLSRASSRISGVVRVVACSLLAVCRGCTVCAVPTPSECLISEPESTARQDFGTTACVVWIRDALERLTTAGGGSPPPPPRILLKRARHKWRRAQKILLQRTTGKSRIGELAPMALCDIHVAGCGEHLSASGLRDDQALIRSSGEDAMGRSCILDSHPGRWMPTAVRMPAVVWMPAYHSRRFKGEGPIGAATG